MIDFGEGQSPKKIPDTFLSLNKKNKLNVQFVQGKFNMGGTGALQFCSKRYNLQLIISKRDPKIINNIDNDETINMWGFTIVRREDPRDGMRSSSFRYLAPEGKVLSFNSDYLPILPNDYPEAYGKNFEWGTFIKLFEYQLNSYKTNILFDLYNRLSLLLPGIALPIRMLERRSGYTGHSFETTMSGLSVRLDEDKKENLEANFPSSSEMKIMDQKMKVSVYAFKKEKRKNYTKNEGIIFLVNGQSQGFLSQSFFDRNSVGMSYISDSILVVVDCSELERRVQEDLFMNSRDRLRDDVKIRTEIENQIEDLIKNHQGLRALREQRRRENIENNLQDSKPLTEALENIIKKSPSLSKLFIEGINIKNSFNLNNVKAKQDFVGKKFPTFFKISKEYTYDNPKDCPINKRFRVQFNTDAENEYFNRDKDPGQFSILLNKQPIKDFSINLWNGIATLTVKLPDDLNIGDVVFLKTEIIDNSCADSFLNEFYVRVSSIENGNGGRGGVRKNPSGEDEGKDSKSTSGLSLPNIIELKKNDRRWKDFFKEERDALVVKNSGENGYDFYINTDNTFLQLEMKTNIKIDYKLLEARFKYAMVLLGVSLLEYFNKKQNKEVRFTEGKSIYDEIYLISNAISPIILPMISSLANMENL